MPEIPAFDVLSSQQVRFARDLPHAPEVIWPKLARAKNLAKWFLPITALEPKLNGHYTLFTDNGGLDGTLTEFAPPHIIQFDTNMRFQLAPVSASSTALTLTLARSNNGWIPSTLASFQAMLDNLERLLDGQPPLERPAYMQRWRLYYPIIEQALSQALAASAPIVFRVHFPQDSDKPSGDTAGQQHLQHIIATLLANPLLNIAIDGFSDEPLDRTRAIRLAQRRAETIRQHLIASGIASNRINSRSLGNHYRLHPGRDETATALNRRVELTLLY